MVTFTVTATDDVDRNVHANCSVVSGSTFKAGKTPVTCSATDKAGNTSTKTFNVTVVYDQPKKDEPKKDDEKHDNSH